MGNMNIHIGTGPKYEYSYNLANLRENWAQKKNRYRVQCTLSPRPICQALLFDFFEGLVPRLGGDGLKFIGATAGLLITAVDLV